MAYSILDKEGQKGSIIHFLADTNEDYAFITDACDPGSTINVLDDPNGDGMNVYMKAPSGRWIHTEGKNKNALPANDVKVIDVPDMIEGCDIPVANMQNNIRVYPQGLVTGESYEVTGNALFSGDEDGHFVTIGLEKPEEATHIKMTGGTAGEKPVQEVPSDNIYMWKLDHMREQGKETSTVTFYKSEDGQDENAVGSFTFNFSQVKFN